MNKITIPFYYINLEEDIERRKNMEEQLNKYVENYYRVEAINGEKYKNNNFVIDGIEYFFSKTPKNNKARGCTLSHIKTFKKILEDKTDVSIICEDDLSFELIDLWDTTLDDIIKDCPEDWGIIKLNTSSIKTLNYCFNLKNKKFINNKEIEKAFFKGINSSTLCYLIKYKAVEEIWENLFYNNKINFPENSIIDHFLWGLTPSYNYYISLFKSNEDIEKNKVGIHSNNIIKKMY